MPSGRGLMRAVPQMAPWGTLFDLPSWTGDDPTILAQDWYFAGRGPVVPVEIPWTWLSGPLRFRQDSPLNAAQVDRTSERSALASDSTSIDSYGQWRFSATLTTATPADPQNLADWAVAYYTDPRVRCPQLRLILNRRTQTECWTVLGREVGDVITITGVPTGWPEGANTLVIEGISHQSTSELRVVEWSTSPLIGSDPDVAGPWFRLGVSRLSGSHAVPF